MRGGKRRSRWGGGYVVNANTYNTNITNITNVTQVTGIGGHKMHGRKRGRCGERGERPPKLTRFCASCGLLDQDVVGRMSDDELMGESAKVVGYAAKGLADDLGSIAGGFIRLGAETIAGGLRLIRDLF